MRENLKITGSTAVPQGPPAAGLRILAVDDSPSQRALLSALLARWGYAFDVVGSAADALQLCRTAPPDIVLSDWMMPEMDGLAFCREFRALKRRSYGYFTLLTSKSDTADVAAGLDAGADDFLTKPVQASELRARLRAAERVIETQRTLEWQTERLETALGALQTAYDAIDRDLRQARRIQESLVPERCRTFGETRVSLLLKPCGHVGGDLVGTFCPGADTLAVYALDVSGHGISSAMVAARVAGYLDSRFPDQSVALERDAHQGMALRAPAEVARVLNDRLCGDYGIEEYLTMLYLTGDLQSGTFRFVQAGHPNPVVIKASGECRFLGSGGLPIGLFEAADHEQVSVQLAPGDRLLLHSDGLTEAVLPDGSLLGDDGLLRLIHGLPICAGGTGFLDALFEGLKAAMGDGAELDDDVSAALVEYRCQT